MMHKIGIKVPRVFYLNSKAPVTEDFPGRRVNKILPHGHHSHNLIEVGLLILHLEDVFFSSPSSPVWVIMSF